MKRFAFATIVSALLAAPLAGAPRPQFDYYLTGSGSDAAGTTSFGLGRTLTFMAWIVFDGWAAESKAIAIDRETAVLVADTGQATIVANADHPTPFAYFIRGGAPQVVERKTPLTYLNPDVQRAAPGSTFDVVRWRGTGLTSYTLNVNAGVITSTQPGGSIY